MIADKNVNLANIPKYSHCYEFEDGFKLCPYYEVIKDTKVEYVGGILGDICRCNFLNITTEDLIKEKDIYGAWLLYDKCKICKVKGW